MKRASGVLLPIFCLPSKTGIGNFSKNAYKFIDLLKKSKQKYWQLLPLNPIDSSNSPYFSVSQFAGCPLFIDVDSLVDEDLLDKKDLYIFNSNINDNYVDYEKVKYNMHIVLTKAYNNFINSNIKKIFLENFKLGANQNIKNYVIFESMKSIFNKPFYEWDKEYKYYNKNSITNFIKHNKELVDYNYFLQYLFFKQWKKLKKYAYSQGISFIGDMPIYSSNDSSDVWANSNNYLLNENLEPIEVAGCPPDAFDINGQLWGNPLYDYDYMKKDNYKYMLSRFSFMFKMYDVVRIDHFRGFESFYAIDKKQMDAKNGIWKKGPGIELFKLLKNHIKNAQFIAEDLGFITDEVKDLLLATDFPGMKVMQFAFSHFDNQDNPYRPHNYNENCVAYLGTHDNDTFMGWYNNICIEDKNIIDNYLKFDDINNKNIKALEVLYNSKANLVMSNIQDILGLGTEARINTPSTLSNKNWSYRFQEHQLFSEKTYGELLRLTIDSNRQ